VAPGISKQDYRRINLGKCRPPCGRLMLASQSRLRLARSLSDNPKSVYGQRAELADERSRRAPGSRRCDYSGKPSARRTRRSASRKSESTSSAENPLTRALEPALPARICVQRMLWQEMTIFLPLEPVH